MPDKLEVLPGPGLVARYEEIAVWAGPQASNALQLHLVNEAQRTSKAQNGGDQLASSLIAILQRGDPEPQAPFAVVGPGANGLTLFLHGPVQAWDSGRWLAPQPVPGWMVTSVNRPWPLIVLPYGATPPPQSQQGNPLDLMVGAVPGAGFVMLRPPGAATPAGGAVPQTTPMPQPAPVGAGAPAGAAVTGGAVAAGVGSPGAAGTGATGVGGGPGAGAAEVAGAGAAGAAAGLAGAGIAVGRAGEPAAGDSAPAGAAAAQAQAAQVQPGEPAVVAGGPSAPAGPGAGGAAATAVDLRSVFGAGRPPLALASTAAAFVPTDQPEVTGVRCELGHFNHPRVVNCMHCGRPIAAGTPQVNGPRPRVGLLLADDGSVWALDRGCLIGTDPGGAPEVQSGAAQPLTMRAGPSHAMAPVQAEIQLRDWAAFLVDRGAEGGSWVQSPTAQAWEQLGRNEQRELADGSHVSCGGRVLTYLSAWPS